MRHKFKGCHAVSSRVLFTVVGLTMFVLLLMSATSCDPVRRYEILKFFFDGVPPPLEGYYDPNDPGYRARRVTRRYEHEPVKDCSICHGERERRGFSADVQLTTPIPELCYACHDDYTKTSIFVHGPVAVGDCLFCHKPHRAAYRYLLTRTVPELCYQCHDQQTIKSVAEHPGKNLSRCITCHGGHSSSAKGLLKENWKEKTN
jgi:predicted CXXCH cytochrome family protein